MFIVDLPGLHRPYALKQMCKRKLIKKNSVDAALNERAILSSLSFPFLVNLKAAFQDKDNLYLLMDYIGGGDLRTHMNPKRPFSESQMRFLAANVVLALEHVHCQGFLHRDIKPENLVLDADGYLRLTDFGIAQRWNCHRSKENSGTPGYMAPEIMWNFPSSFESDFYGLGVVLYECLTGKRPYSGITRKEVKENILAR